MTTKTVKPRRGRGKAAAQREADELTAERIRVILSDPKTPEGVKSKLTRAVSKLAEWAMSHIELTPEFMVQQFADSVGNVRAGEITPTREAEEAAAVLADVTGYAEQHEPKAYRIARRCRESYFDWLGRHKGRKRADGAYFFLEHVDGVLEVGKDGGLLPNPGSKYFVPLFVDAWRECGPKDRRVRRLLDLIKRVDEGADLNALRDEDHRAFAEHSAKRMPKDERLIRRLSAVLADPKRGEDHDAILVALCGLHNDVGARDTDPEIFPTMLRALIDKAREARKGLGRVAELEGIAGGKGGAK